MNTKATLAALSVSALVVIGLVAASGAEASHAWANYHWKRSANPAQLTVGDNLSAAWDPFLDEAITDWNVSTAVHLTEAPGLASTRTCKPVAGRIEVCNSKYGRTGWVGIAQIWVSGDHITQGVAKMNDTYFSTATYNKPAWKRLVMCQEVAHGFGLDHQDEAFGNANLGSCMDYTNDPDGPLSNEHPNAHDFEQLDLIYGHLDAAFASLVSKIRGNAADDADTDFSDPREWGREMRENGHNHGSVYVRDLGNGKKVITHVLWVEGAEKHAH